MWMIKFLWSQTEIRTVCNHTVIYFQFTTIKYTILTALTPQTTVVFPSLTKAEPSAVDIEPENIDLKNGWANILTVQESY